MNDILYDRRETLKLGMWGFLSCVFSGSIGIKAAEKSTLFHIEKTFNEKILSGKGFNQKAIELLIPKGKIEIATATIGAPKFDTYSNEKHAIKCLRSYFDKADTILDSPIPINDFPNDSSVISIGGSGTNHLTKDVLGHPKLHPEFTFEKVIHEITYRGELPFTISKKEDLNGVLRYQDGNKHESWRYSIMANNGEDFAYPDFKKEFLEEDYLLLTNIPLYGTNHNLTILAGLHGPSIRSIQQLLTTISNEDLNKIERKVGSLSNPFQAVFRAYDLVTVNLKDVGRTTVPRNIMLVDDSVRIFKIDTTKNGQDRDKIKMPIIT